MAEHCGPMVGLLSSYLKDRNGFFLNSRFLYTTTSLIFFLYMKYLSLHHLPRFWGGSSLIALNRIWETSNTGTSIGVCHFHCSCDG